MPTTSPSDLCMQAVSVDVAYGRMGKYVMLKSFTSDPSLFLWTWCTDGWVSISVMPKSGIVRPGPQGAGQALDTLDTDCRWTLIAEYTYFRFVGIAMPVVSTSSGHSGH